MIQHKRKENAGLADKADATQGDVEDQKRVYSDPNTIPDNTGPAHDTNTGC
jgi:hypothetical protein